MTRVHTHLTALGFSKNCTGYFVAGEMTKQNGCLIGLFALGDPVFNLSARDAWVGWPHGDRCRRLVHVMDAYVVGALPPYSLLIGGKLVAALMGSAEVKGAEGRTTPGAIPFRPCKRNEEVQDRIRALYPRWDGDANKMVFFWRPEVMPWGGLARP